MEGTIHFTSQKTTTKVLHKTQDEMTPESKRIIKAIKKFHYIDSITLAKKLKMSNDKLRRAIDRATFCYGSRIYEETIDHRIYYGWLD